MGVTMPPKKPPAPTPWAAEGNSDWAVAQAQKDALAATAKGVSLKDKVAALKDLQTVAGWAKTDLQIEAHLDPLGTDAGLKAHVTADLAKLQKALSTPKGIEKVIETTAPITTDPVFKQLVYDATPDNSVLFASTGPQMTDVNQAHLPGLGHEFGDCYFMASLAAVVHSNPGFIEKGIKATPDPNKFIVTLYRQTTNPPGAKPFPVTELVDLKNLIAKSSIDPTTGKMVLWPALYEKAFEQYNEKYKTDTTGQSEIGNGGQGAFALTVITGFQTKTLPNPTGQTIRQALADGYPVGTSSNSPDAQLASQGAHAYTVVAVSADGTKITLRNPYGVWNRFGDKPSGAGVQEGADGTATMSMDDFKRAFGPGVDIGGLKPQPPASNLGAWVNGSSDSNQHAQGADFYRSTIPALAAAHNASGLQNAIDQSLGALYHIININKNNFTHVAIQQDAWVVAQAYRLMQTLAAFGLPQDDVMGVVDQANAQIKTIQGVQDEINHPSNQPDQGLGYTM